MSESNCDVCFGVQTHAFLTNHCAVEHDRILCPLQDCGRWFADRNKFFQKHVLSHFDFLDATTIDENDSVDLDAPRTAQQSRDEARLLGTFPTNGVYGDSSWRWKRPVPRAWFPLDTSSKSKELIEYHKMLKQHLRERLYYFRQWLADRGLDTDYDYQLYPAMENLDDSASSFSDDLLGKKRYGAQPTLEQRSPQATNAFLFLTQAVADQEQREELLCFSSSEDSSADTH